MRWPPFLPEEFCFQQSGTDFPFWHAIAWVEDHLEIRAGQRGIDSVVSCAV